MSGLGSGGGGTAQQTSGGVADVFTALATVDPQLLPLALAANAANAGVNIAGGTSPSIGGTLSSVAKSPLTNTLLQAALPQRTPPPPPPEPPKISGPISFTPPYTPTSAAQGNLSPQMLRLIQMLASGGGG